ncbi:MAG: SpoIIE family protein phosphatase, partial [bacterium]
MLERNPGIYGTCVAFEPNSFFPDKHYWAPYFYQKDGTITFVQLGNEDYDYFKWDWYALPKAAGKALWTEPYFDTGGGEIIMTTYSVPFHKDGRFWGIATIDISMEDLMDTVRRLQVGQSGYAFILSREGKFVTHPDPAQIMKGGLYEFDEEIARRMTAGQEGMEPFVDPISGRETRIVYTPIRSSGWSFAVVYPLEELMAGVVALQKQMILIGGIGLGLIFLIIALLAGSITRPLQALVQTAMRVAEGDLDQPLPPTRFRDEIWELSSALGKMMTDLKQYMEDLKRTISEKERIESELKIAREIQESILPRTFPPFPNRNEFDVYAVNVPAKEVGGDFYDFFLIDEDTVGFVIADVSGKGVPAALYMAVSRTLLRATALRGYTPGECLSKVNQLLLPDNYSAMFVTLFYATLDLGSGHIRYANGGHNFPYLKRRNGKVETLDGPHGIILGVMEDATYVTNDLMLESDDLLLLYTDGVTEAQNAALEFYTDPRLKAYLEEISTLQVEEVIHSVQENVHEFCAGAEQSDDITILALQFCGKADA